MFEHLIGNENVKLVLRRLVGKGRVPNSLLFVGDEGVGKRLFAIEVAKAFLCKGRVESGSCGVCSACTRAGHFVFPKSEKGDDFDQVFLSEHPDLGTVIPFRRNVRIGAIRALEREANFRPYEAPARFFIVDDAEKMADPAANALLKTLEEPPATTHIILITSRPDALLPTIRSRVQTIKFAPIPTSEIEDFLIRDRAFSRDEARLAARASRGSLCRAVSMNPSQFLSSRDRMVDVVRGVVSSHDRAAVLRVSEEMSDAKNKERFEENLDILESLIHDVWTLGVTGDANRITNSDISDELKALTANTGEHQLSAWLASIETMRSNFTVNINRRVATDALFTEMAGSLTKPS
jgi:DNA polymerase-3 subunit delta'